MSWQQLVTPNTSVQDYAGFCLRFVQSVNGSPARYASAWDAWLATEHKHETRDLPDVSVPCWFEHWGTYGEPPTYGNWGHVVQYVPGAGFVSSPVGKLGTYGQSWFGTLEEVERTFNARFVGWSEDINGLKVVENTFTPDPASGDENMYAVAAYDDGWAGFWNMTTGQVGHIDTVEEWNRIAGNLKVWKFADSGAFNAWKAKYATVLPLNVDSAAIAAEVVAQLGNTEINVDALASAIAAKIETVCNCGCGVPAPAPDVTTKEEILASIEANYPEDK